MHRWNVSVREAIEIQRRLRDRLVLRPPRRFRPRYIAGADVSTTRFSKYAYGGLVVLDIATRETVDSVACRTEVQFPYVPGLLSFRELPALRAAWARLRVRPDVVIFDGVGLAHPRRFGLACHGGLLFDVPSIGCSKSLLVGEHAPLGLRRGAAADLLHRGEVVGRAVRLRDGVKPVYISAGHLMDLRTAVRIVESVSAGYRLPETTRRAHALVNDLRRRG